MSDDAIPLDSIKFSRAFSLAGQYYDAKMNNDTGTRNRVFRDILQMGIDHYNLELDFTVDPVSGEGAIYLDDTDNYVLRFIQKVEEIHDTRTDATY